MVNIKIIGQGKCTIRDDEKSNVLPYKHLLVYSAEEKKECYIVLHHDRQVKVELDEFSDHYNALGLLNLIK